MTNPSIVEQAAAIDVVDLIPFLGDLEAGKAAVLGRLAPPVASTNDLMTPEEVARLLYTDVRFVYRHKKELGGVNAAGRWGARATHDRPRR